MADLQNLFDRSARAAGATLYWTTRAARLMVGVPDYETPMWSSSVNGSRPGMRWARVGLGAAVNGCHGYATPFG